MDATESVDIRTQTVEKTSPMEVGSRTEARTIVKILAIVIPLLSFLAHSWIMIAGVALGGKIHYVEIAAMAGNLMGVFLMPAIITLFFQIWKKFRNARSRWTIFMNTALFFLAASLFAGIAKVFM